MLNIQNIHSTFFSPRELARIAGVSESSIKRWVDSGRISTTLTAGGHRRIPLTEALRFIRRERITPEQPERLGLVRLEPAEPVESLNSDVGERLYDDLIHGRDAAAIALIQSLFLAGRDLDRIIDGPFCSALERLGELWHHGTKGIYREHRATQICIRALHGLRAIQTPDDAPKLTALGGAHEDDPYILPSLAVATVLETLGVPATDLGPNTPIEALCLAMQDQRPDIVWLSISALVSPEVLSKSVSRMLVDADAIGAAVIVGGRQAERLALPDHPRLFRGHAMTELSAFAKGMVSAS